MVTAATACIAAAGNRCPRHLIIPDAGAHACQPPRRRRPPGRPDRHRLSRSGGRHTLNRSLYHVAITSSVATLPTRALHRPAASPPPTDEKPSAASCASSRAASGDCLDTPKQRSMRHRSLATRWDRPAVRGPRPSDDTAGCGRGSRLRSARGAFWGHVPGRANRLGQCSARGPDIDGSCRGQMHDDALTNGTWWVAREERGGPVVGLVDDPDGVRLDDLGRGDDVLMPARRCRHDHLVARHKLVEATEVAVVAHAVTSDDHVANLARHRCPRPMPGTVIERRQSNALVHRTDEVERGDLDRADLDLRLS